MKFENFSRYVQLYPEYGFVFTGDSGQGLARVARAAREDLERVPFESESQRQARRLAELTRDLRRAEALTGTRGG